MAKDKCRAFSGEMKKPDGRRGKGTRCNEVTTRGMHLPYRAMPPGVPRPFFFITADSKDEMKRSCKDFPYMSRGIVNWIGMISMSSYVSRNEELRKPHT
jgi:hypothetical protein